MSHRAEVEVGENLQAGTPVSVSGPAATISAITVPTCNRVEGLERTLLSFMTDSVQSGRTTEFVVADDSPDKSVRQRYVRLLQKLSHEFPMPIRYIGLEEKIRFAKRLIEAGKIPLDVVRFALFHQVGGQ